MHYTDAIHKLLAIGSAGAILMGSIALIVALFSPASKKVSKKEPLKILGFGIGLLVLNFALMMLFEIL